MKHIKFIPTLLICLTGILSIASCTNDDPVAPSQTQITNNVQSGSWIITAFVDSGKDETNHFNGYTFTFASNNIITSTNGSTTYTGTWTITDNNSNDDSLDNIDFNIQFNLTNDFESLNEDWQIVSQSATRIELIHISGGNGGTDYLTFEKI